MLVPVGTDTIYENGEYVLEYKKGCIKHSKNFKTKKKLLRCIDSVKKRRYSYQVYMEMKT